MSLLPNSVVVAHRNYKRPISSFPAVSRASPAYRLTPVAAHSSLNFTRLCLGRSQSNCGAPPVFPELAWHGTSSIVPRLGGGLARARRADRGAHLSESTPRRQRDERAGGALVLAVVVAAAFQGLALGVGDAGKPVQEQQHHHRAGQRDPDQWPVQGEQRVAEPVQPFEEIVGMARVAPQAVPAGLARVGASGIPGTGEFQGNSGEFRGQ